MIDFPKELAKALFAAQGEMRGVQKDGTNPHYKSRYATLENVTDTIRPVLQKYGILFMQAPGRVDEHGVMDLTTYLLHAETGQASSFTMSVPLAKRDPQGIGSAITYACRYSLMALLGLPPVDDDGESAGKAETNQVKVAPKEQATALHKVLQTEMYSKNTVEDLKAWVALTTTKARMAQLPINLLDSLRLEYTDTLAALKAPADEPAP